MKDIFEEIEYCNNHQNLYIVDCAYCLLDRRTAPVINLDDYDLNCKVCLHEHEEACNCGCPAVRNKEA